MTLPRTLALLVSLAALLPTSASAQTTPTLRHVRLEVPRPFQLAEQLELEGFDVVEGSVTQKGLELVVSVESEALLRQRGLPLELIAIGRPYYEIQAEAQAAAPEGSVPSGYSDLNGVYARMQAAAAAAPGIAQVVDLTATFNLPLTHQGRSHFAIKISDNVALDEDEPNMLIVSDYHAREIVTPEIALTAMSRLVNGYGSDPAITAAVNGHEIWIAPVWNPDGYVYVFTNDNLWRKNRRNNGNGTFGVDLNRNFPFAWSGPCAGSTSTSNETYKGPFAGSEPEVQAAMGFAEARRFAKVIDYHSFGREVLWAYAACSPHPFGTSYLRPEAIALSTASGYAGSERPPSADGEHYEWLLSKYTNYAFLIETHTTFQPSFASAQSESNLLWPGALFTLQRPMPLWGRVTDAGTGQPLQATVRLLGVNWSNGETNSSGGPFARYYGAVAPGTYNVEVSAPCHQTQVQQVNLVAGGSVQLDFALASLSSTYCTSKVNSQGCAPQIAWSGTPSASAPSGYTVSASQIVQGQLGTFFYGTSGPAAIPFQGGFLCVQSPVLRTPVQPSGGAGPCGGAFTFDFNTWIDGGADPSLTAGVTVRGQYWSRDPGDPFGTNLSNALQFVICP